MTTNSNEDKRFLNRLTKIVETNLSNEQFGVSELAREMGISRSHLFLKVRAVTKKSVSHFIRTVRLIKAMEMLQQNEATASEIAYMVGFSSPAYFSHCFHEHFGLPPGEVKRRHLSENGEIVEPAQESEIEPEPLQSDLKT